ncbi:hypothetical protein [Psychrobacillus sp. L4]|uniref:hypothetical protein n=1 Tax=Psychrobacillus sp. L4 TaxID=3236892 RepID=UPI0036F31833
MEKVIGLIIVFGVILKLEIPNLLKNKDKKGLIIFTFLIALSFALSVSLALNKTIPNPADFLSLVLKPIIYVFTTQK